MSVLVLSLMLVACGRAPAAIETDALFPLAEGHSWTYRVTTALDDGDNEPRREQLTLRNRGKDSIDGGPAWRRRSDSGVEYWLRSDDTGIYRVATKTDLDRERKVDNPRRYVLQKPYAVGTEWEASTIAYVLQRKNEVPREIRYTHKPVAMKYRIEALGEKVETPAGTFDACLRVHGEAQIRLYVDAMFAWRDIPLTTLEWYCPGVGLVRLERREPSPSKFTIGGTMTMELTAWK